MSPNKSLPSSAVTLLVLALTSTWVAFIEFREGASPLLSYDEAWHLYLATIGPAWKTFLAASGDSHPPVYYLIMRPFFRLAEEPILAGAPTALLARLPTILATILTVPVFFALLRKIRVRAPVALTVTLVLALSFPFLHLGVTARQYSVTLLLLLVALWFLVNLIPGGRGRPSRWSAVLSLLLLSVAFATLYATVLLTAALFGSVLLVMAVDRDGRAEIRRRWRDYSSCPEWVFFLFAHLLVVAWYVVGWAKHINFKIPSHVAHLSLGPNQAPLEFLHQGLRRELELFTPLTGMNGTLVDIGLIATLLAILWLGYSNLRRGKPVRAMFALTPLLLTGVLAATSLLGKYPFGGALRHQYLLFPMLLILLALGVDALWRRLTWRLARALLLVLVVGTAAYSSVPTLRQSGSLGEAGHNLVWPETFEQAFKTAGDEPLLIPSFLLYPSYADRYQHGFYYQTSYQNDGHRYHTGYQGWLAIGMLWAPYEEFRVFADDGRPMTMVKDHYRWMYPPVPDSLFFRQTRGLLEAMGRDRIRVLGFLDDANKKPDPEGLRAAAAANGFVLSDYVPVEQGALWTITLDKQAATTPPSE